ncbi:MAG: hypothetical protein H7844_02200 [Nitrospirae bacterium YQR-1]
MSDISSVSTVTSNSSTSSSSTSKLQEVVNNFAQTLQKEYLTVCGTTDRDNVLSATKSFMENADSDGDSYLSSTEASTAGISSEDFTTMDVNSDDKISTDESMYTYLKDRVDNTSKSTIVQYDTDSDGYLSSTEAESMGVDSTTFNTLDHDADGQVTYTDLTMNYSPDYLNQKYLALVNTVNS